MYILSSALMYVRACVYAREREREREVVRERERERERENEICNLNSITAY